MGLISDDDHDDFPDVGHVPDELELELEREIDEIDIEMPES